LPRVFLLLQLIHMQINTTAKLVPKESVKMLPELKQNKIMNDYKDQSLGSKFVKRSNRRAIMNNILSDGAVKKPTTKFQSKLQGSMKKLEAKTNWKQIP